MSTWVSVYCQKPVGSIELADLVAAIRERVGTFSDLYAPENAQEALARLRGVELARTDDFQLLHLHYLAEDLPIVMFRFSNPDEVAVEVQGRLEQLPQKSPGKGDAVVRAHLGQVVEIFHFSLKQQHTGGMGTPLVYAASAWIADAGKGLIRVEGRGWMQLDQGGRLVGVESA